MITFAFFTKAFVLEIILGTESKRRVQIFQYFNLPFSQKPSFFEEEEVVFENCPKEYAQKISEEKSFKLYQKYPNAVIISADTIVYQEGICFGKPKNEDHASQMLKTLSGKWHSVFTAISVRKNTNLFSGVEETKVLLKKLSEEKLKSYIKAVHSLDKAGGYAIQGPGEIFVETIVGSYSNVMGFPISLLETLLLKVDIDLWKHLEGEKT